MTSTSALAAPDLAAWLREGHALLAERDAAQWRLADWIARGRETYGPTAGVVPAADHLKFTPYKFRAMAKVSRAFPPEMRDARLSFDVHAHLAGFPDDSRAAALARAAVERWGEREAKVAAVEHRQAVAMFDDEDAETRQAVEMMRAWNRSMPEARDYFMALAQEAGSGVINDNVTHD